MNPGPLGSSSENWMGWAVKRVNYSGEYRDIQDETVRRLNTLLDGKQQTDSPAHGQYVQVSVESAS